jgi:hypothetical protein
VGIDRLATPNANPQHGDNSSKSIQSEVKSAFTGSNLPEADLLVPNSYLSPQTSQGFPWVIHLLTGSDLLVVPPVFRPQYNHIICPLPATEHLPTMDLLNFSSTFSGPVRHLCLVEERLIRAL